MNIRGLAPSNEAIGNIWFDERAVNVLKSSVRYQVSKPSNNTDTFTYFRGNVVNMMLPGDYHQLEHLGISHMSYVKEIPIAPSYGQVF